MITWREPEQKTLFPLTHPQKRIWYTEQIQPGTGMFNIGGVLRIKGKIDPAIMEKTVRLMVERNDALRLKIINIDGEPKQYARELVDLKLPFYDFSQEVDPEAVTWDWLRLETAKPFPDGEMFGCALIKLGEEDFVYLQKCHHAISDGWSFALKESELNRYYTALVQGQELGEMPPSYLEFLEDEAEYRESNRFQKNRDFWLERFQNLPQAVTPSAKTSSSRLTSGVRYRVQLDEELTRRVNEFVKATNSSVYTFFTAIYFTYLYRVSSSTDIIIGTPVLNRGNARQKETIGMFVSTMPFRIAVDEEATFSAFLKTILDEQRAYYRHQRYPMDLLVKDLELARRGNQKLFEVSLSYQNSTYHPYFNGTYPIELDWIFNGFEENSLTVHINDRMDQGELIIDFDYALDAFDQQDIERLSSHLIHMVQAVLHNPDQSLWQIPYMSPAEVEQVTQLWNETQVDYPRDKCIYQLIEEQVERTPDAIAVVYEGQRLTYRQLNNMANALAKVLETQGVRPDTVVGLLVERNHEAVAAILGILKAGGAYLPIDPDYPTDRITFMLQDTESHILLTQSHLQSKIPADYTGERIDLDQFFATTPGDPINPAPAATPENLCYLIYTSGSTGKPKGVMVEHRGLTNYIWWGQGYYTPNCPANFALYSTLSFDLTVTSIYMPLVKGSTIYVFGNDRENLIGKVIKCPDVNIVKLTPAHLALIKEEDNRTSSVRKFILGGEELKTDICHAAVASFGGQLEIYNEYGPTETVVGCMIYRFQPEDQRSAVLIGKPIPNAQIYILDRRLQPVPVGVTGEIYIGGDGVTRGYLNRPELTAERFHADPFRPGNRMYKSGDLGRFLPDGNIEYLGRADTQVKIRGYRIEIGEIESALLQMPGITDAVVIDRLDRTGSKYLAGYFVAEETLTTGELRAHLLQTLPEYMVPTVFVQLETIPLNQNGKVDRNALPEPEGHLGTGVEYAAPTTDKEEIIAQVWAEVLGLEKVGIHDNFFELGGDSIKAIQVSTRLKNRGIQCQVQNIFNHHTVGQVALHVTNEVEEIQAEQGNLTGETPLTPIQHWFFDQKLNHPDHWNQSVLLNLSAEVAIPALEAAFQALLEQHDALRFNYQPATQQMVYEPRYLNETFQLLVYDLEGMTPVEQEQKLIAYGETLKAHLRIQDTRLIQAALFELGDRGRRLLITVHHLAVDGVSWRILLEDLGQYIVQYQQSGTITRPPKTTSYREWAHALQEYSTTAAIQKELLYWEHILAESQLIPTDLKGADDTDFGSVAESGFSKVTLSDEETTALLTTANEAYNTQINDLLLTALAQACRNWTGNGQTAIRLEGHGREELFAKLDISRTVGWFTSIYPVLLDLRGYNGIAEEIKGIKEQIRQIPQKGIGYGIAKYLTQHPFTVDEQSVTGILFNYLGQFDQELQNDFFGFASEAAGAEISAANQRNSLMEWNCMVVQGCLEITVNYSANRLNRETVESLLNTYLSRIREIIQHCSSGENYGFTPSDFDTVELSQEDLDELFF